MFKLCVENDVTIHYVGRATCAKVIDRNNRDTAQRIRLTNSCTCYTVDLVVPHSWYNMRERDRHMYVNCSMG